MMGNGYAVSCDNCGFDKRFIVGTGNRHSSLEAVIDQIHHMRRTKVLKLLNEHTVHETGYEHRIYRCECCGQLRNSFWAKIVYDDDEVYETNFQCGKCHKPMTNMSDHNQLRNESCPCCGNKKLRVVEDLLLDSMDVWKNKR